MHLKKTFELRNPKYYKGVLLKIWKFMEVREKYMEVQEETAESKGWGWTVNISTKSDQKEIQTVLGLNLSLLSPFL